jgi:putative ABC transport system permease protein
MVINERAVKLFGYSSPQEAVGRKFKQWGREGKIIGVVKDFHFKSLQEEIKPLSMRIEPEDVIWLLQILMEEYTCNACCNRK